MKLRETPRFNDWPQGFSKYIILTELDVNKAVFR